MSQIGGEELRRRMRRLEAQIEAFEHSADAEVRDAVREMLQTILDFHGAGLGRMLELIAQSGEPERALLEAFGKDGLAASLLLLYGLHPLDLETRVRQALDGLGPQLRVHGQEVEFLAVAVDSIRLRLRGGAVTPGLRSALEEALRDAAPEANTIAIDEATVPAGALISLPLVGSQPGGDRP